MVFIAIVTSVIFIYTDKPHGYSLFWFVRPMLYIGLYMVWGFSIAKRIVDPRAKRYLITVAILIILWWFLRVIRYNFSLGLPDMKRFVWYCYYIPMILIPQISLLLAFSFGKHIRNIADSTILQSCTFLISCVLIGLVLTNDMHQLVFVFEEGITYSEEAYHYGFVYFLCVAWMAMCAITMFGILLSRIREVPKIKYHWLPLFFIVLPLAYVLLTVLNVPIVTVMFRDTTAALCLMFAGCLECCIQIGLIPSNTQYEKLFSLGSFRAQIVDDDYQVCFKSQNAGTLKQDTMKATENGPVLLDGIWHINSLKITAGRVIWQDDISEIMDIIDSLEENNHEISQSVKIDAESYRISVAMLSMQEKQALLNLLHSQMEEKLKTLDRLLLEGQNEQNQNVRKKYFSQAVVLGAFIKRRGNLILLKERFLYIDSGELQLSVKELFSDLGRLGIESALDIPQGKHIVVDDVIIAFDGAEQIIEKNVNRLQAIFAKGVLETSGVSLRIQYVVTNMVDAGDQTIQDTFFLREAKQVTNTIEKDFAK